jgi:hypothetical protein
MAAEWRSYRQNCAQLHFVLPVEIEPLSKGLEGGVPARARAGPGIEGLGVEVRLQPAEQAGLVVGEVRVGVGA